MFKTMALVLSGLIATKVMTDIMLDLPKAQLPEVDIPAVLGSKVNDEVPPPDHSAKWEGGLAVHYALGALVFPFAYELAFKRLLPGNALIKGTLWGVLLWSFSETVVMPTLGKARFFHRPAVAGSYLIGHLFYGAIFGALSRSR